MELHEFIKKFYENTIKIDSYMTNNEKLIAIDNIISFIKKGFPKALRNYTDIVCERQRNICLNRFIEYDCICGDGDYEEAILYAEHPIIEEL